MISPDAARNVVGIIGMLLASSIGAAWNSLWIGLLGFWLVRFRWVSASRVLTRG
jgi:hypothetical protein